MFFTLHQLQIFLQISKSGSITKAAEALHLTQPAVSIQLRNLQDQFELPLTEVIGRKLYITDFGEEVAHAAGRILDEARSLEDMNLAYKGILTGKLKISVVSTGKYVMPYFLSGFTQQNKGVELIMDVTNRTYVISSLEANEIDLALVSVLPKNFNVEREELMENQLFLVGSPSLLDFDSDFPIERLEEYPLIFRENGSATRMAMENFLSQNKLEVRKKLELTSNEAVKQALIAGLGLSIMPIIGIRHELDRGTLHIIPLQGLPIITNWNLIWLKGKKHNPAVSAFLNFVREEKANIIKEKFSSSGI
ncbi:MAG: LysR family transcriptional regulator [Bacteroidota bacterium]